jgi:hypothetical protein
MSAPGPGRRRIPNRGGREAQRGSGCARSCRAMAAARCSGSRLAAPGMRTRRPAATRPRPHRGSRACGRRRRARGRRNGRRSPRKRCPRHRGPARPARRRSGRRTACGLLPENAQRYALLSPPSDEYGAHNPDRPASVQSLIATIAWAERGAYTRARPVSPDGPVLESTGFVRTRPTRRPGTFGPGAPSYRRSSVMPP